jgi:uncharacterized protein YegP (UPF0339 family)
MATMRRELHLASFRFQIKKDRDGRHRWYLYNASGTIVGRHTAGFPSELEAYEDVEHVRKELAVAPIIGENAPNGAASEMAQAVQHQDTKKGDGR